MAKTPGARDVVGSRSGTLGQDPGVYRWQQDPRDKMEASDALYSQYKKTLDLGLLNRAIVLAESAIPKITSGHPDRPIFAAKLQKMFGNKYEHTQAEGDLDLAWVWAMEEIDKTPQNMTNCGTACSSILDVRSRLERVHKRYRCLGADLYRRYMRLGNLADLNEAIIRVETAIETYPTGSPDRDEMLNLLSVLLRERFERLGGIRDLELAAGIAGEVVRGTSTRDPRNTRALGNLGGILLRRFERFGDLGDLREAIKHGEEALATGPLDHPDRAGIHGVLGYMLSTRFRRLGDLGDLQKAIMHGEEALSTTPLDHPNRAGIHSGLEDTLYTRFDRIGDLEDLQKAIKHGEEALSVTPLDDPNRAAMRNNLGTVLYTRFRRIGDLGDLQKAIEHGEEALSATPLDHPVRPVRLGNLRDMLSKRFEWMGDLGDLQKAIQHGEEALAATPLDHPGRAGRHNDVGTQLSTRFERLGDLGDLQKGIKHGEEGLAATPLDHPDRPGRLENLANMLSTRFERMGDLGDLQKAINNGEEALAATPLDHPDRARKHNNLGNRLGTRFERIGDLGDLHNAIKHGEEALAATPQDHPHRVAMHNNLGARLFIRFERIGDLGDLHKSTTHSEKALAATPQDHPHRVAMHNNLGIRLAIRFERIGDLGDLHNAIKHGEEALAATPVDHPDRGGRHTNMANTLSIRFERIGDLGDLQKAIKHGEEALAAIPQDHPQRAGIYTTLGKLFESRSSSLHSAEDFKKALSLYYEAYDCRTSPPRKRVLAARKAASLQYLARNFLESSSILEDAVNLMPTVDLRFLKRDDQQHILSELSGLASVAASMALQAGRDAYHGLKLLELGRGIITGFSIDARSEASDLKTDHPLVFAQFDSIRVEIDSPMDGMNCATDGTSHQLQHRVISRRWEAVNRMEEILKHIRSLPGYGGFLLPPTQEALMRMAANGPIVVFNSTIYRSDAIIVTTSAIASLELPRLGYEETTRRMRQLASFGGGSPLKRGQDTKEMKGLLLWLWDAAVGPVFDHLEGSDTIFDDSVHKTHLRRIWWIGVGQLSMAPFHAAGDHSPGSTRNTLSRAISTYIPTIKTLSYARQTQLQLFNDYGTPPTTESSGKSWTAKNCNPRLLLVPMPKTPGAPSLPGVDKEIRYIRDSAAKNLMEPTVLKNPTPAKVLKQVRCHEIVHFACHGVSEFNPSDSHLVLFNEGGNATDKLLARDISILVAKNAQIAYLSACSTAKNPSAKLADEVIHLASAFQLAGFSHTFANMWETNDHAACEVARDFYDLLLQYQEDSDDDHRRVSIAFYKAVKKVRDRCPGNPLIWAPFIHTGA